jgi:predicted Zn finger-like uncharacterized protein
MSVRIVCPECRTKLNVGDELLGKRVKCPGCSKTFTAEEEPPPVDQAAVIAEPELPELPKGRIRERDPEWDEEEEERPRPRRRRRRDDEDDDGNDAVSTIIPYKNPMALAAYYCGVFGLIPCVGGILGPIALIFGIVGMRAVKRDPRMHGTGHAIAGIVLGGLETLAHLAVVGFIAGAALLK